MTSEVFNTDCLEYMRTLPDKAFALAIADPPYGIRDAGGQTGGSGKLKGRVFNNGYINYFDLPPSRCFICWDKVQPWENFSQVEFAWTSFDSPAQLFRFDNRTGDKIHPTQKPVELYAYLLRKYAKEGDRIFDPMMGSQSSRIAAYKLGFDYVGCEIDTKFFADGCERFNRECKGEIVTKDGNIVKQMSLFD